MVTSTTAHNGQLPEYLYSSMAHPYCDNPHIRQQSSEFGMTPDSLQQQSMVPTLLNMISQLTSLLNESYARQNTIMQSHSNENELNKKIEQLVAEVEYYKKECNRLKEEKEELWGKWGKSNWCKWIEKNRLREEKENFQKSLEVSKSKCKVLEQNVLECKEEKAKIQQKWKESNRCKWEKIHQQRLFLEKMQSKLDESFALNIGVQQRGVSRIWKINPRYSLKRLSRIWKMKPILSLKNMETTSKSAWMRLALVLIVCKKT